jgi:transposase
MPIVPTPPPDDAPRARFLNPLWQDDHPQALDLQRRLPHDHLARQIDQAVRRLDLRPLHAYYGGTGDLAYPPDLLLKVVLYATRSARQRPAPWHKDARESEPVRWLLQGCTPSRSCWYAFRDRLGPVLDERHRQSLAQAVAEHLTPATRAAQDGTLAAANASRHKLVSEAVLRKRERRLADACAADARGEAPPDLPGWMAKRPSGRRRRQRRLRSTPEEVELSHYRCAPGHCTRCPLGKRCTPNPARGRSISRGEHEGLITALRARTESGEAKALYRLRSQTVELVKADWKEHRRLRHFSGRGLSRARTQVGLIVLAHNLVTLVTERKKAADGKPSTTAA